MNLKQLAKMLSSTTPEEIGRIPVLEKEGKFNEHLLSNEAPYIPVDKNYEYLPKGAQKIKNAMINATIVHSFGKVVKKLFQTEVHGRENLKNIKSAIVVCNHVNKLDCMAIKYALRNHKTYFTAMEQNNMQGTLGDFMRASGMLPLSSNLDAMKNCDKAITALLKKGNYVTFFAETSEWWGYQKPRPQNVGAYKIAIKNNVPIIPIFITFRETEESKNSELGIRQFVVNIMPAIYPDVYQPARIEAENMKNSCEIAWKKCYEQFYKESL